MIHSITAASVALHYVYFSVIEYTLLHINIHAGVQCIAHAARHAMRYTTSMDVGTYME